MYKTAVYTSVNGVITHQKQQISKKVILRSMTLPKCQCTAEQYHQTITITLDVIKWRGGGFLQINKVIV